MPRGVYERKPKGEKAAAPAKKAPVAKAVKAKLKADKAPAFVDKKVAEPATPLKIATVEETSAGLYVLGQGIATLGDAYEKVKHNSGLEKLVASELTELITTFSTIRQRAFAGVTEEPKSELVTIGEPIEEPLTTSEAPAPVVAAPAVVAPSLPTLPTGNSGFTPPAPPVPHH